MSIEKKHAHLFAIIIFLWGMPSSINSSELTLKPTFCGEKDVYHRTFYP